MSENPEGAIAVEEPKELEQVVEGLALKEADEANLAALKLAAEHDEQVREKAERVQRKLDDWETAKENASDCKKEYDESVTELLALIRSRVQPTLFQDLPAEGEAVKADDESWWRDKSVEELEPYGVSERVAGLLLAAGITNLGDLADYTKPSPTGFMPKLTDIKGIGEKTAEKIEEASADWFRDHEKPEVVVDTPDPPDGLDREDAVPSQDDAAVTGENKE